MKGEVIAICTSPRKGTRKTPKESGYFQEDYGLVGDAHAEKGGKRQVSLLSEESIQFVRDLGLDVGPATKKTKAASWLKTGEEEVQEMKYTFHGLPSRGQWKLRS